MGQMGFFDLGNRYSGLDAKNEPLLKIDGVVPWEDSQPAGVSPAFIRAFSSRLLRCLGTATIEASMIWPPIAR